MNNQFIPFALPDIQEAEIDAVVKIMRSGWLTTGPETKKFEQAFSDFLGDHVEAIAVNSATAGLHLAIEAVGVKSGDYVITSPYTFTATAEVVRYLGAHPIFVDIDQQTLNMSASKLREIIIQHPQRDRIKAIIPVHIAGLACDMKEIVKIAKEFGLKVIEDAAHALPATYGNRMIGTLESDATVFSFYATKTITTGEGGMLVTKDPQIANRCRTMRLHGINRDVFDRYTSKKPAWFYEVVAPGFKYNMTDLAAAIGVEQLKKAWSFHEKRKMIAEYYLKSFADLPIQLPACACQSDVHSWHLFIIRLAEDAKCKRDRFIEMMSTFDIGCSVHFIPLHMHPYWKTTYGLQDESFPAALQAYQSAVSLPIYTKMNDSDVERVAKAVRTILMS